MRRIRAILDELSFEPVETAKYMQFVRDSSSGTVKIDLLVGPLGPLEGKLGRDRRRARPPASVGLHARRVEEALGIELRPFGIPLRGQLLSGDPHEARVVIPSTFPYLLMKLMAFRDRVDDADKDMGRYHAVDLYRIVGMTTEPERDEAIDLARRYSESLVIRDAASVIDDYFGTREGLGRLRIREWIRDHDPRGLDLDRFTEDLRYLLGLAEGR
jgi:hypothetical protein